MSGWSSGVIALAPLVAMPLMAGWVLPGPETSLGTRWWFGVLSAALVVLVGHGIGLPEGATLGGALLTTLALFSIALRRRSGVALPVRREIVGYALLVLVLLGPALAACLYTLRQPVFAWDGFVIWYAKVRGLYEWRPLPILPWPLQSYPDLGPTCWMLVLKWVGADHENIGRLIFPAFYFMWIAAMLELFGSKYSWPSLILLPAVATLFFDLEAFTNGYQDGFMMVAAGMSAIFVVKNLIRLGSIAGECALHMRLEGIVTTAQGRQDCYLAAFFAGVLGLIKQEGMILGLILMVSSTVVVFAREPPRCWPALVRLVLPFAAVYLSLMVLWPVLLVRNGVDPRTVQGPAFTVSSVVHVLDNLHRWSSIRPYFVEYYESLRPVMAACLVLSVVSLWLVPRVRQAIVFLWVVLGLHMGLVLVIFLVTRQPLHWHLETAFKRLTSQNRFVFAVLLSLSVVVLRDVLGRHQAGDATGGRLASADPPGSTGAG